MVYVDKMKCKYRYMIMCHMFSDSIEELHLMADKVGVKRKWFQNRKTPHYDICLSKKKLALQFGAIEIDNKKVLEIIKKYKKSDCADKKGR